MKIGLRITKYDTKKRVLEHLKDFKGKNVVIHRKIIYSCNNEKYRNYYAIYEIKENSDIIAVSKFLNIR